MNKTSTITVRLRPELRPAYRIEIRAESFNRIAADIENHRDGGRVFVVTDSHVSRLYGKRLWRDLASRKIPSLLVDFPAGESSKTPAMALGIQSRLLKAGIERGDLIVALGGGVVGDLAGYVAATILRGVRFVQVPTTLLAQVDSSVGGKVGVDHPVGKNLIGAFHQPRAVFIDPEVLQTLPAAEFRNGLSEVVKIAAGLDRKFFSYLERNAGEISRRNPAVLAGIIARSVGLKASVVEKDERETGLRKVLNIGHTIGHAIEASAGYAMKHGAAVSIGLVAESRIAVQMGILKDRDLRRILALLHALHLPVRFPALQNRRRFFAALSSDKKSRGGIARFVLLKGIGYSVIGVEVPTPFITSLVGRR